MERACVNHPESPAIAACKSCATSLCLMCANEVGGDIFCSAKCAEVYAEVKAWVEPMAKPEDWNPLAEPAVPLPQDESMLDLGRMKPTQAAESDCARHPGVKGVAGCALCHKPYCRTCLIETEWGSFCSVECSVGFKPASAAPSAAPSGGGKAVPMLMAAVAVALVVVGVLIIGFPQKPEPIANPEPAKPVAVAKPEPAKPVVVAKPEPANPEPAKPVVVVKPEPAKPEPAKPVVVVKPEPAKPEPAKPVVVAKPEPANPEPAKPVVVVKPEPAKPDPAKPVVVAKPEPAKPEPAKPVVVVKPEPAKPEPAKPVVIAKPEPPKPEPAKPEPAKPVEVAKPLPPEPVVPPPPLAAPRCLQLARDPWADDKPGGWYRLKTTTPDGSSYTDVGLKERTASRLVLVSQTGARPVEERTVALVENVPVARERQELQGVAWELAVLRPSGGVHVAQGPHAGVLFVTQWNGTTLVPLKFGQETIAVRDRKFDCLVLESTLAGSGKAVRLWLSAAFPAGPVREEGPDLSRVLVEYGDDWGKRPPFPETLIAKVEPPKPEPPKPVVPKPEPPKPEPPKPVVVAKPEPPTEDPQVAKVRKTMEDATRVIREATPLYKEVADSLDAPPSDRTKLLALLERSSIAQQKLRQARTLYEGIRAAAPDPAVLGQRIEQLDGLLESLQGFSDQLRGKLK